MANQSIAAQGTTQVRVSSGSGRVKVVAGAREDVAVSQTAEVSRDGLVLTVTGGSDALLVHVPAGMDLLIGTEASRVEVTGPAGAVAVVTTSGRVSVESAGSVDVRTTSGRVEIDDVGGACRVRTDSGRVQVGSCGPADVATDSGRIELASVAGPVQAHCTSGRVDIVLSAAHPVDAETVSGRIQVQVPPGVEPEIVNARSISGRVKVQQG